MDGAKYGRCSGESDRIGGSFSATRGLFGVVKRDALVKKVPLTVIAENAGIREYLKTLDYVSSTE